MKRLISFDKPESKSKVKEKRKGGFGLWAGLVVHLEFFLVDKYKKPF